MVVPSLAALVLKQPFVVSPNYFPVLFIIVSQITLGMFMNLEDLLAENIIAKQKPRQWLDGLSLLLHMPNGSV